ncbi:MAG: hypothetical protein Q9209_001643 [Squamulea sp. 1 TL-2023]
MGLRLYTRQRLSSPVLSQSYTRTYDRKFKEDNKITHRPRKSKAAPKTCDSLRRASKARTTYWQTCLSKIDNLFNAVSKVLTKARARAGLLGIIDQFWRPTCSLATAMIIDQTRADHSDIVTRLMGQIYSDIDSARITRQANVRLQGRLSSMLSGEEKIVCEVLEYTASWFQIENNVTCGRTISVPTSVSSEVSHVCKRFARVKSTHGWMILSVLAHSESFRNACRTFDGPLWEQMMYEIGQNHISLELFFKVRALDWAGPLRSVAHLIPEQDLRSYLNGQEKRELQAVYLQTPHSYVVPNKNGALIRPHHQGVIHLNISSSTYDSKVFPEDPSIRTQDDGICECCGRISCDCEPSTCDRITRPLTELIHCSGDKGVGVRTLQRIREGEVLDEYVGELKRASSLVDQTYAMELEGLPADHRSRNDNNPILIDAQVTQKEIDELGSATEPESATELA